MGAEGHHAGLRAVQPRQHTQRQGAARHLPASVLPTQLAGLPLGSITSAHTDAGLA